MTHALKTWPQYFAEVKEGRKPFELRKNDRNFKVGDKVLLQEYHYDAGYTGDELEFTITYILSNAEKFGLKKGYVILGLKEFEKAY